MTPLFTPKKIVSDKNIGAKLKQARAFRGLELKKIGQKLKIKPEYLEALEESNYQNLPLGLYSKSYLKKYADFLGLNYNDLLQDDNLNEKHFQTNDDQNPFSQPLIKKSEFIIFPKIIRNILIALVIITCLLYLGIYIKKIFFAPYLIISQPNKNLVMSNNNLEVIGQTEAEAEVRINDELVLNNKNGHFSKTVTLKRGLNNIVIKAKKKYSQTKVTTRQILIP